MAPIHGLRIGVRIPIRIENNTRVGRCKSIAKYRRKEKAIYLVEKMMPQDCAM